MVIQSCTDEVVEELAKNYLASYDFILNRLNITSDHELKVAVKKSESDDEEDKEEEEGELVEASRQTRHLFEP